ncbi:type IV pilus secretin family protein [Chloracidobacterium thermophilum]|uniref:type IV pilus secretin family protein n=1 Tax=Chloracidobacterium thermophilum TaxID=458033 RepID=UPI0007389A19|nr:type IV pilus secretin family protein [Chloracidobacterium thermophilum]
MKSLPKRSCAGAALFLLCGFGWCGAIPLRAAEVASETVVVSTLDVRSDASRVTCVQLQSTARLDYNVSKPEPRLVSIDLYGADTSALQPEYRAEQGLVASVAVKAGLVGEATARLDITLREDCHVRSYLRNDAKTLVIEFEPLSPAVAGGATAAGTPSVTPATGHSDAGAAASAPTQPVVFSKAGAARTAKATGARSLMLQSVTLSQVEQTTMAELGLTAKAKYNHFLLQNPPRLVVDLFDAVAAVEKRVLTGQDKVVSRVRVGEPDGRTTRVVFDLKQAVAYTVSESETGLVVQFGDRPATTTQPAANPVTTPVTTAAAAPASAPDATPAASTAPAATEAPAAAEPPVMPTRQTSAKPEPAALTVPPARSAPPVAASAPTAKGKTAPAAPSGAPANAPAPSGKRAPQGGRGAQFGDPSYQGDPVSLDITNVDLSDILRFISDNYDVNFVLDKSVGRVSVTLKVNQVPWTQVLESIFRANQLTYRREGLIVRVATVAAITAEEQNRRNQRLQEIYSAPTVTEYFKLKYERVDQNAAQQQAAGGVPLQSPSGQPMGGLLGGIGFVTIVQQALSPAGRISINPRTNTVIITDIPSYLEQVRDVIARLDVPEPQVEIEARIVFASRNFARELGVQLFAAATTRQGRAAAFSTSAGTFLNTGGTGGGDQSLAPGLLIGPVAAPGISGGGSSVLGLTTGPIGTALLAATLTANEQKGIAKSIAAPRVTVLNNAEASIVSGTQIPFIATAGVGVAQTVTFVNANIGLTITPQITTEGNVLLRVAVTNDAPGQVINGFTSISRRTATTQVIVPDGGTTIIGGVLNDLETTDVFRTPGISSLPLLGELFKRRAVSRTTGELLFFITPRIGRGENILSGGEPPASPQPATSGGQP